MYVGHPLKSCVNTCGSPSFTCTGGILHVVLEVANQTVGLGLPIALHDAVDAHGHPKSRWPGRDVILVRRSVRAMVEETRHRTERAALYCVPMTDLSR